jgi:choline dehydrogenase-like flavoprotein
MSAYYDVIIIGSGAGGGTLARHLAPSGKKILIRERGGWLPREPENWRSRWGRMAKPEEIGSVVAFLAGAGASYVTATTIFTDGGIMHCSPGL